MRPKKADTNKGEDSAYIIPNQMELMTESKEILLDGYGRIFTPPLTHNQRKRWMKENFSKISYLQFVNVLKDGKLYKLPLDKYREKYKEENNIF